jgi:hypothetical protein
LNTRNNTLEETDKCIRCFKFKVITSNNIDILLNGRNSKEYKKNKQIKKNMMMMKKTTG